MEERVDRLAFPEKHLSLRRLDRGRRARALAGDAAVDLAANVGVEIEGLAADPVREGVRACGDGLRFQCFVGPGARHLLRHDALEVLLEPDDVDGVQLLTRDADLDLAAVGTVELERFVPGRKRIGPASSVGAPFTVTHSFGPSTSSPAGSG